MVEIAILNRAVTEDFTEKVIFQQSSEKDEATTHRVRWGKNFLDQVYQPC